MSSKSLLKKEDIGSLAKRVKIGTFSPLLSKQKSALKTRQKIIDVRRIRIKKITWLSVEQYQPNLMSELFKREKSLKIKICLY
jgi:hypothetical protein